MPVLEDNRATNALDDDVPVMVAPDGASDPAGMVRMSRRDYYT